MEKWLRQSAITVEDKRLALDAALRSRTLCRSDRLKALLRFICEAEIEGRGNELNEYTIGVEALGRPEGYATSEDSSVRSRIFELRQKLEQYYSAEASDAAVRIEVVKGSHNPRFVRNGHVSPVWVAIACAATLLALVAIAGWLRPRSAGNERQVIAFRIASPAGIPLAQTGAPELSPDGSAILYGAAGNQMYVRRLDSLGARPVPGRHTQSPFWSADSTAVVYPNWESQVVKVRMPDGAPEVIATSSGITGGGKWSDAGTILVPVIGGLGFVPASGGELKPVEMPRPLKEGSCYVPEFLPGGQDFLFLFAPSRDPDDAAVYLATLRDGKAVDPVLLLKNQTAARYTPAGGGRILFVRNDNLYSQKLNRRTRKLEGEAELVAQEVASQPSMGQYRGEFSVARNGTIAWRPGRSEASQVTEFDRNGNQTGTSGPPGSYDNLVLSPDERQLLVSSFVSGWLVEVGRSGRSELAKGTHWFGWSPGGSKLIGVRGGAFVEMFASGSVEVRELRKVGLEPSNLSISSDGKQVLANTKRGILSVQLDGTPEEMNPRVVVDTQAFGASFSPDGRWFIYHTPGSGGGIYVQSFPGPGLRRQIAPGGESPFWRRDGKEILYRDGDALMSVAVQWNGTLKFGAPRKLFSGLRMPAGAIASSLPLAVSHNGSRIFWPQRVEQADSNVIYVKIGAVK
jgi:hypothetical protein